MGGTPVIRLLAPARQLTDKEISAQCAECFGSDHPRSGVETAVRRAIRGEPGWQDVVIE